MGLAAQRFPLEIDFGIDQYSPTLFSYAEKKLFSGEDSTGIVTSGPRKEGGECAAVCWLGHNRSRKFVGWTSGWVGMDKHVLVGAW
jgi:hypothetical protein